MLKKELGGELQILYEKKNKRKQLAVFLVMLLVLLVGGWSMTVGVADTDIFQVCRALGALFRDELSAGTHGETATYKIIAFMRFPRIVMAVLAGIGLSLSGVAMQGITGNPLVSPFTIGISNAAAFGASAYIVFAGGSAIVRHEVGTVLSAFACAILCASLVYLVARRVDMGPETIILVGIALNYLFSAMTATVEFFAQEHKLAAVVQWTFGTFNGATWNETAVVAVFVVICTTILVKFALPLNIMAAGDDELVCSLGFNPDRIRVSMGILSVLMTSAVISFTGVIGFVGLAAPHIARMIIGSDHRFLIPFSGAVGAILLLLADVVGKTILSPVNIPVGIVVSFLGVPLFVNLILSKKKGGC